MDFHFKLMLWVEKQGKKEKMYALEFIQQKQSGNNDLEPDLDSATIDFFYDGTSYIAPDWNLGRPDWLLPQLKHAVEKIKNSELVLVRSAVIEGSEIPYLVFQPGKNTVGISLIVFDDYEIEQIFPSGPFSEKAEELYQYFFSYKDSFFDNLNATLSDNPDFTEYFKNLEVDTGSLLQSLTIMIKELEEVQLLAGRSSINP